MLMMKWPLQAMPTFTSSAWCAALKVSSGSTLPGEPSSRRPTRYTWTALPSADANTMARLSGLHRTRVAWSYSTFTRTDHFTAGSSRRCQQVLHRVLTAVRKD
uniref:Putative secreted protein n=1 Tax=Ixodes ricinus TaxID=34613 RepID=A0A6B0UCL8_IXORI